MLVCEQIRLDGGKRQRRELNLMGDRTSRLWNAANYRCRQAFLKKEGVPQGASLERVVKAEPEYRQLPSDIAQEVLKKLSEAWASYFALRKKWFESPAKNQKPGLPRYRKDNRTGTRPSDWIPVKHSRSYSVSHSDASVVLPRDRRKPYGSRSGRLHVPYRGRRRFAGKMGRAELLYNRVRKRWHMSWSVTTADPEPVVGERCAAIDLGVRIMASLSVEDEAQALHFENREAMKDWDWLGQEIAREQAHISGTRGVAREDRAPSSRNVAMLHAKRTNRLVHAQRAMAKSVADTCVRLGVSKVFLGHPKGILRDVKYGLAKWAERIHNMWSFGRALCVIEHALRKVGIMSERVGERGSSSTCSACGSKDVIRHPRWLLRCEGCGERIHSDQGGSRRILQTNKPSVCWDGAKAAPRTGTKRWTRHRWLDRSANPKREASPRSS